LGPHSTDLSEIIWCSSRHFLWASEHMYQIWGWRKFHWWV